MSDHRVGRAAGVTTAAAGVHRQRSRVENRREIRRRLGETDRGSAPLVGDETGSRAFHMRRVRREDAGRGPLAVAAVILRLHLHVEWQRAAAAPPDVLPEAEALRRLLLAALTLLMVALLAAAILHLLGELLLRRVLPLPRRAVLLSRRPPANYDRLGRSIPEFRRRPLSTSTSPEPPPSPPAALGTSHTVLEGCLVRNSGAKGSQESRV